MVNGLWGKKIGMTQVFSDENKIIPVTVIDLADWFVTQIKTAARDGYNAIQIGCVRKRYSGQEFSAEWLKKQHKFFGDFREIRLTDEPQAAVGQAIDGNMILASGDHVDVFGTSIGRGFQGGVKRHGFAGGPASHGSKLGRAPGSLSGWRSQGRVMKNKRMPGHMGVERCVMKNLKVIKIEPQANVVLVKGSIPGKTGSLVFVQKHG